MKGAEESLWRDSGRSCLFVFAWFHNSKEKLASPVHTDLVRPNQDKDPFGLC